jgi:protein tyrosine phosphatase (PTP) superfamily phosphohydrolase (DUF442 family)
MLSWVIDRQLARGSRPGYRGEEKRPVSRAEVDAWLGEVKAMDVRSIICVLADEHLDLYADLPDGLLSHYRRAGFAVEHVPALDHKQPPLTQEHLAAIWHAHGSLPKPVLVHCSGGADRTGAAITHIQRELKAGGSGS